MAVAYVIGIGYHTNTILFTKIKTLNDSRCPVFKRQALPVMVYVGRQSYLLCQCVYVVIALVDIFRDVIIIVHSDLDCHTTLGEEHAVYSQLIRLTFYIHEAIHERVIERDIYI